MNLKTASEELGRRVIHSLSGIVAILYLLDIYAWSEIQALTALAFVSVVYLEYDRLVLGNSFFPFYRNYEKNTLAGYSWAVFGIFLAVFLFKPSIAVVSIFLLSFADPIQGIIYNKFGPSEFRKIKPVSMLSIMFLISLIIATSVSQLQKIDLSMIEIISGALGATLADGTKFNIKEYILDDNLTIPLYSGLAMTITEWII